MQSIGTPMRQMQQNLFWIVCNLILFVSEVKLYAWQPTGHLKWENKLNRSKGKTIQYIYNNIALHGILLRTQILTNYRQSKISFVMLIPRESQLVAGIQLPCDQVFKINFQHFTKYLWFLALFFLNGAIFWKPYIN